MTKRTFCMTLTPSHSLVIFPSLRQVPQRLQICCDGTWKKGNTSQPPAPNNQLPGHNRRRFRILRLHYWTNCRWKGYSKSPRCSSSGTGKNLLLPPPLWGEERDPLQMLACCKCSPNDCCFPVSGGKETTSSLASGLGEERTNSLPPTAALPADSCQGVQRPTEIMAGILMARLWASRQYHRATGGSWVSSLSSLSQ